MASYKFLLKDRVELTRPNITGYIVFDVIIPIALGQRQLLLGDNKTGKTSLSLSLLYFSKNNFNSLNYNIDKILSIFCGIGIKEMELLFSYIKLAKSYFKNYIFNGGASKIVSSQYLLPFEAFKFCEILKSCIMDSYLIMDNFTQHAIIHREFMLKLGRPPGREAYPGDIFFLHSNILEKAGKISKYWNNKSITSIPVIQTQKNNVSAYIPTNVISITDGQWFLDTSISLLNKYPSINISKSVSRIGGKAQEGFYNLFCNLYKRFVSIYTKVTNDPHRESFKELILYNKSKMLGQFLFRNQTKIVLLIILLLILFVNGSICFDSFAYDCFSIILLTENYFIYSLINWTLNIKNKLINKATLKIINDVIMLVLKNSNNDSNNNKKNKFGW